MSDGNFSFARFFRRADHAPRRLDNAWLVSRLRHDGHAVYIGQKSAPELAGTRPPNFGQRPMDTRPCLPLAECTNNWSSFHGTTDPSNTERAPEFSWPAKNLETARHCGTPHRLATFSRLIWQRRQARPRSVGLGFGFASGARSCSFVPRWSLDVRLPSTGSLFGSVPARPDVGTISLYRGQKQPRTTAPGWNQSLVNGTIFLRDSDVESSVPYHSHSNHFTTG